MVLNKCRRKINSNQCENTLENCFLQSTSETNIKFEREISLTLYCNLLTNTLSIVWFIYKTINQLCSEKQSAKEKRKKKKSLSVTLTFRYRLRPIESAITGQSVQSLTTLIEYKAEFSVSLVFHKYCVIVDYAILTLMAKRVFIIAMLYSAFV